MLLPCLLQDNFRDSDLSNKALNVSVHQD